MAKQVVQIKKPSKRKGPLGVVSGGDQKKEKKKPEKCSTGTVYNAKLKKCVSNKKKGETLLEWRHRNMLKSITKKKPSMS